MKKKSFLRRNLFLIIMLLALIVVFFIDQTIVTGVITKTKSNFLTAATLLPPILILAGLLDAWIPKEVMIKYMGKDSGLKGFFFAFILGAVAAGPLYLAYPIAAMLIKKKARYSYVVFFLGVWSGLKLPILIYEYKFFDIKFTIVHFITVFILFLITSLIIEKLLTKKDLEIIEETSYSMIEDK